MGEAAAKAKKDKQLAREKEAKQRESFEAEIRKIDKKILFITRWPDDYDVERYRGHYKNGGIQDMWEGYRLGHAAGYEEGVEDTKPKFE